MWKCFNFIGNLKYVNKNYDVLLFVIFFIIFLVLEGFEVDRKFMLKKINRKWNW